MARWLDAEDRVLGWTTFYARMPGDGTLRSGPVRAAVEQEGSVVCLHIHWPDLHVQTRVPAEAFVRVGDSLTAFWPDEIVQRFDDPATHPPVPPVTVRMPVSLSVPVGQLATQ